MTTQDPSDGARDEGPLFGMRAALILTLALLAAVGGALLLHAGMVVWPIVIFASIGVFATAAKFFSWLIGR